MSQNDRLIKNIKTGGSMAIYIGTASVINPIVKEKTQDKNGIAKACALFSGTVISCGLSALASKAFNDIVDKVSDFIFDVRNPGVRKDGAADGGSGSPK